MSLVSLCMPMAHLCIKSVCASPYEYLTHLSFVLVLISELQHAPLTPKVLQDREYTLTPSSSIIFILGFTFESFKEFGGASRSIKHISSFLDHLHVW
jgi:hypothetical protein